MENKDYNHILYLAPPYGLSFANQEIGKILDKYRNNLSKLFLRKIQEYDIENWIGIAFYWFPKMQLDPQIILKYIGDPKSIKFSFNYNRLGNSSLMLKEGKDIIKFTGKYDKLYNKLDDKDFYYNFMFQELVKMYLSNFNSGYKPLLNILLNDNKTEDIDDEFIKNILKEKSEYLLDNAIEFYKLIDNKQTVEINNIIVLEKLISLNLIPIDNIKIRDIVDNLKLQYFTFKGKIYNIRYDELDIDELHAFNRILEHLKNKMTRKDLEYVLEKLKNLEETIGYSKNELKKNENLINKYLELTMDANSNFKTFIQGLLEQADIGADFRQLLTQPEPLKVFQRAFVHNTYDSVNNYEVLEYVGDGIVKAINSQYVPKRFKDILTDPQFQSKSGTKEGVLSKIRRYLEQTSFLFPIALKLGFWDHVKADYETKTTNRNKVLEDVMEAYIGALTTVIDKYITDGFGYMFSKKFLENQLDQLDIVITPEVLDDPITRLNELYKASILKNGIPGLKWGDAKYIEETLILPRVTNIDNNRHPPGYAVFNESDNLVYITDSKNWYTQNNLPINLRPVGLPLDLRIMSEDDKKRYQAIHWIGVLGYPPSQGQGQIREKQLIKTKIEKLKDSVSNLLKQNLEEDEQSLKNIGVYINNLTKEVNNLKGKDAQIIGQGIAFVKKDAKKKSAKEALEVLKQAGYEK